MTVELFSHDINVLTHERRRLEKPGNCAYNNLSQGRVGGGRKKKTKLKRNPAVIMLFFLLLELVKKFENVHNRGR